MLGDFSDERQVGTFDLCPVLVVSGWEKPSLKSHGVIVKAISILFSQTAACQGPMFNHCHVDKKKKRMAGWLFKKSVATIFIMLVENKLYINIICSIFNCFCWLIFNLSQFLNVGQIAAYASRVAVVTELCHRMNVAAPMWIKLTKVTVLWTTSHGNQRARL